MFRGFRYRRGLTHAAFAELAGLPLEHVTEWEERKRRLSPSDLRELATCFNVSVSDLLLKPPKDVSLSHGATRIWLGPKPWFWGVQEQARWGALPYHHFGYLRLQLTAAEGLRAISKMVPDASTAPEKSSRQ